MARLTQWRSIKTLNVPLLWSLHIAYLFMAIGLFMLGLSYYNVGLGFSNALHLITIGAIGLMILSMMSRVSLGHTGRPLKVKGVITLAFALMTFSALIRAILPGIQTAITQQFNVTLTAWNTSGLLWLAASLIFTFIYWPVLTSPNK
ncbi:MAG: NnrS family protein [Alteromonadaceae bacterium]|nr:NnrS family protein [Alteromonadaceae bacterium]